jgi:hypothetical protein
MITLKKHSRLTESEMKGIAGTELFSELMRYKYRICCEDQVELDTFIKQLEQKIHFAWYFQADPVPNSKSGLLYFSSYPDVSVLTEILDEYSRDKD